MKALTHQTFLYKNWSTNSRRFGNICCMLECSANNGSLQTSILVVVSTMGFKYVFVPASPNDDMQAFFPCNADMYFCNTPHHSIGPTKTLLQESKEPLFFGLLAAWCWSPVCMFPDKIDSFRRIMLDFSYQRHNQSVWCSLAVSSAICFYGDPCSAMFMLYYVTIYFLIRMRTTRRWSMKQRSWTWRRPRLRWGIAPRERWYQSHCLEIHWDTHSKQEAEQPERYCPVGIGIVWAIVGIVFVPDFFNQFRLGLCFAWCMDFFGTQGILGFPFIGGNC